MTISTESSEVTYNGNGLTSTFPFTFPIFAASHLVVTHIASDETETVQVEGTNYTLTWVGPGRTGSVNRIQIILGVPTAFPLPTGESYRIERIVPLTQQVDLVNNTRVRIDQIENGLDYVTQITQQLDRTVDKSDHAAAHLPGGTGALPWTTIHGRGLASARPVAGPTNIGFLYFSTDTQALERSNGVSWQTYVGAGGGGGGGVTDHGALTGLAEDDHTQYHTDARGDARYAPVAHVGTGGAAHANAVAGGASGFMTGADKTKIDGIASGAEVNVNADWNAASGDAQILNKPTTMAPTAHASTHNAGGADAMAIDAAAATGSLRTLGTAATAACAGNDSRLTNSRTPTAHASTHNAGGADAMAVDAAAATGSLRTLGTAATAACAGNDSRLTDARTPTSHTHGNITNAGAIGTTADLPIKTTTSGVLVAGAWGSTAGTFTQGNDSRLSDNRTPTAHVTTHAPGGSDPIPWTTAHGRGVASARPVAAASNAGYIYFSSDTQVLERSTGAAWENIGSAGTVTLATDREVNAAEPPASSDSRLRTPFALNYITNPDAEVNTTGWATYADAAGVQPVDGVSGSPVVTWTRSSTLILRGTNSFVLTKDGSNRQGQGVSYDFVLDQGDLNKSMTVAFDCKPLTSAYVANDISVWVYNTTTGTLCPISGSNYVSAGGKFVAQFSVAANYSYRLIIHVSGTTAAAWDMFFDNFYVGPVYLPSSPAMSDWQDGGAITITATPTSPTKGTTTKDKVWWRRVGDSGTFRYELDSGAGSAGSGDYLFTLPAGLSFGPQVTLNTGSAEWTSLRGNNTHANLVAAGSLLECSVSPYDSTRFRIRVWSQNGGQNGFMGSTWGLSAAVIFAAEFTAPISGWSGSTAVQPGSRYLWAQRFAANAVRVTAAPSKPGEYRARRVGTDTAPNVVPSVANGLRVEGGNGLTAGYINRYDVYVGPGKVVQPVFALNAGRTGEIACDVFYTSVFRGITWTYDAVTGVASLSAPPNAGEYVGVSLDLVTGYTTCYADFLVADDPVPVALAPAVHVEASSDAGQSLTGSTTNLQYEDEAVDTHGAWSGSLFTAPVAGVYLVRASFSSTGTDAYLDFYVDATYYARGNFITGGQRGSSVLSIRLAAGQTLSIRSTATHTRAAVTAENRISITRIGDA